MIFRIKTSVLLRWRRHCREWSKMIFQMRIISLITVLIFIFYLAILSNRGANKIRHSSKLFKNSENASIFGCGDGKIRGVNLGGWLVLEPWITPSIFEEVNVGKDKGTIVDEWTFHRRCNISHIYERLERHWDEFYTKEDLGLLAEAGITHIRIPIGYWMFDVRRPREPFPPPPRDDNNGQRFYLRRLVKWADDLGLRVLLDLHAAPGSQNGFDNSGRMGTIGWVHGDHLDRTVIIVGNIALMAKNWIKEGLIKEETLYGIAVLNEPAGQIENIYNLVRTEFYPRVYAALRLIDPDGKIKVVIDNAFRGHDDFIGYMSEDDGYRDVVLDMHHYQCFGSYWSDMSLDLPYAWNVHYKHTCSWHNVLTKQSLPAIVGEWSLATTDCQKYLHNGYDDPYIAPDARSNPDICKYYNSDFSTYSEEYKDFLKTFMLYQMEAYEASGGWFFWTAKTENHCAPEWDYLFLIKNGIAPTDMCSRKKLCDSQ